MISNDALQYYAQQAGLDLVAAVPIGIDLSQAVARYTWWVDQGYAGDMRYLKRPEGILRRGDPGRIFPAARTVIVAAVSYAQPPVEFHLPAVHGRVAMYAWGDDYHLWLKDRMLHLIRSLEALISSPIASKTYVDTWPVLERTWAFLGGLGWLGKNACLINPHFGSWLFLVTALVDLEIEAPQPGTTMPDCGNCTRCLDACPTGALVAPGVVDSRKCLSYLTIEHHGEIPAGYRPAMGTSVFGCDICQLVCPWNQNAAANSLSVSRNNRSLDLLDMINLDEAEFQQRFQQSPIWRATAEGLARNAAVVLGNIGDPYAKLPLQHIASNHPSPLVAAHARWALDQIAQKNGHG